MRLEGWEERLADAIARSEAVPFAWGVSDCLTLPLDVIEALTGERPEVDAYEDAATARAALKARGWRTLKDAFASHFPSTPPALAQRGDIGIAVYEGARLGGGVVIIGADVIGKGEHGVVRLPRSALIKAFAIR